jgi:hypothetical protein
VELASAGAEGLPMLLGLSATTTALAVSHGLRGSKGAGPVHSDWLISSRLEECSPPSGSSFFFGQLARSDLSPTLAWDPEHSPNGEIPENFNQLMGASSPAIW